MREEVRRHQAAGRATFIVSAAGNELVQTLAQVLGMDGGIGTRYEVTPDGKLTGRIDGPFIYGEGKVERCARSRPRTTSTWPGPMHIRTPRPDLPMLRLVATRSWSTRMSSFSR